ncbi:hypothetical protein HU200_028464 [Digitaria exilis]|uniref:Uncharacterized protein n=1 Tax=Digitaria exilis TaxID=1010633 RepID=A0A835BZV3_9POAL|nr:hypothetical protein HU200_028464 [Digitaria exilis]CAB3481928.1 unnamed protein product [Digitaria exilis]
MGSCASKPSSCFSRKVVARSLLPRPAAVHPWTPPPAEVPPGQRVTVWMRATEFHALAVAHTAAGGAAIAGDGVGQLILDGCAAGRWSWSPAPE